MVMNFFACSLSRRFCNLISFIDNLQNKAPTLRTEHFIASIYSHYCTLHLSVTLYLGFWACVNHSAVQSLCYKNVWFVWVSNIRGCSGFDLYNVEFVHVSVIWGFTNFPEISGATSRFWTVEG